MTASTWLLLWMSMATAFTPGSLAFHRPSFPIRRSRQSSSWNVPCSNLASSSSSLQGDTTIQEIVSQQKGSTITHRYPDVQSMTILQLKTELFDLLATMTGKSYEFRRVEELINTLEALYAPAQTLEFYNLVNAGKWQLLFSTNLVGTPNPQQFRLRSLTQTVRPQTFQGNFTNEAVWDLCQQPSSSPQSVVTSNAGGFDCTGQFRVQVTYEMPGTSVRQTLQLGDHVLLPARGSPIPQNIPALVGYLHRSIPPQLFDPSQLTMDTTYVDEDLRIVRYSGNAIHSRQNLEGVRDVFRRIGKPLEQDG